MQELHRKIFDLFTGMNSDPIIAIFSPIMADLPIFFVPIFLVLMWIRARYFTKSTEEKYLLMHIFYGCVIGIIIALIIQSFIVVSRPELAIESSKQLLLYHLPEASFPSDHATVGMAFAFGLLFAKFYHVFGSFLPWCIMMLLARIIIGIHWPIDIIVGSCIGIVSAYISMKILKKLPIVEKFNDGIIKILSYVKL